MTERECESGTARQEAEVRNRRAVDLAARHDNAVVKEAERGKRGAREQAGDF